MSAAARSVCLSVLSLETAVETAATPVMAQLLFVQNAPGVTAIADGKTLTPWQFAAAYAAPREGLRDSKGQLSKGFLK